MICCSHEYSIADGYCSLLRNSWILFIMAERIEHIDIAKGISITLVAMFHSNLEFYLHEILMPISLFRIPLFFFLSGVFFSYTTSPKEFLIKKSEALLKPFFAVLIVLFLIHLFFQEEYIVSELKGILYGNGNTLKWVAMWFLPHLFMVFCFSYILFKFTIFHHLPSYIQGFFLLMLLSIGIVFIDSFWYKEMILFGHVWKLPGLPFSVDIILITSIFFITGHLLKEKVIHFFPQRIFLILSVCLFFCIIWFSNAHINLNIRIYTSPIAATIGAFCGIYIIMSISWFVVRYNIVKVIFLNLGAASLYILIFHMFIGRKIYNYFSLGVKDDIYLMLLAIIAFLLSLFLPLLIKKIVLKNDYLSLWFLPFKSNKLLQNISFRHRQR